MVSFKLPRAAFRCFSNRLSGRPKRERPQPRQSRRAVASFRTLKQTRAERGKFRSGDSNTGQDFRSMPSTMAKPRQSEVPLCFARFWQGSQERKRKGWERPAQAITMQAFLSAVTGRGKSKGKSGKSEGATPDKACRDLHFALGRASIGNCPLGFWDNEKRGLAESFRPSWQVAEILGRLPNLFGFQQDRPDYLYFRLYKESLGLLEKTFELFVLSAQTSCPRNCDTGEAVSSIARCVGRSAGAPFYLRLSRQRGADKDKDQNSTLRYAETLCLSSCRSPCSPYKFEIPYYSCRRRTKNRLDRV